MWSGIGSGCMVVCLFLLFFTGCGKNAGTPSVFIIGNDTLSIEQIRMLDPQGINDSATIRNTGIRLLWSEGLSHVHGNDTLVVIFLERLLLLSGSEWNNTAAGLLLKAAQNVAAIDDSAGLCIIAEHRADSLCKKLNASIPKPFSIGCTEIQWCDTAIHTERTARVAMLQQLFGISSEIAGLCYEFVFKARRLPLLENGVSSRKLVAGLVASINSAGDTLKKKSSISSSKVQSGRAIEQHNSVADVLRFRDEKSIRDSIDRHIPNIRQLYKKVLKKDATMTGKVIVNFRVAVNGSVIEANVKSSGIQNQLFLDPFMMYIKTIRFKPVPEKAGMMLFDFPFEFNTEM